MKTIPKTYQKVNNPDIDCDMCFYSKANCVSLYDDELSEQKSRYYCYECLLIEEKWEFKLAQHKKEFETWHRKFSSFLKEIQGSITRI